MNQEGNNYDAHLSATNMYISSNGSLVVYFKTKPKFIGFYIFEIPGRFALYFYYFYFFFYAGKYLTI